MADRTAVHDAHVVIASKAGEVPPLFKADAGGELHPVARGIEQCPERGK